VRTASDFPGALAPAQKSHQHDMVEMSRTLEGTLTIVMGCRYCARTESVTPNKRMRKIREGFSPEDWIEALEEQRGRLGER